MKYDLSFSFLCQFFTLCNQTKVYLFTVSELENVANNFLR